MISGNCMGLRDRALSKIGIEGILKTGSAVPTIYRDASNKKKKMKIEEAALEDGCRQRSAERGENGETETTQPDSAGVAESRY